MKPERKPWQTCVCGRVAEYRESDGKYWWTAQPVEPPDWRCLYFCPRCDREQNRALGYPTTMAERNRDLWDNADSQQLRDLEAAAEKRAKGG